MGGGYLALGPRASPHILSPLKFKCKHLKQQLLKLAQTLRCPLAPHVQTKGCLCPTACSCPPGLAQPRTLTLLLSFNFLWGREPVALPSLALFFLDF